MGRRRSEYSVGVYDARHFDSHVLDSEQRRAREHAAAKSVLLQAIRSRRTVFGRSLRDPRAVFQAIDRDGSGAVSPDEFATGLQRIGLGLTAAQSEALAQSLDTDGDGEIGWEELARFLGVDAGAVPAKPGEGPATAAQLAGRPALRIHFDPIGGYSFEKIDSGDVRQTTTPESDRESLSFFSAQGVLEMPTKAARDELFKRMDPNANKQLSMNEFTDGLAVLLPQFGNQDAVRRAFVAADRDQSGLVSRREFRLLLHYTIFFHKKAATFHKIDSNGDGRIDFSEFCGSCAAVGVAKDAGALRAAFDQLDIDGGGYVRFSEFATWCARTEAVSQGWDRSGANAYVSVPSGGLSQKPRKLQAITPEEAQLQHRRQVLERRLRRDSRTLRRLEASQDAGWRVQARRSLCCHASHSYRDLRMRCPEEPGWVDQERSRSVRHLSATRHVSLHQAEDAYMRTVAFLSIEGGDPLESSLLSESERHAVADEMRVAGESGEDSFDGSETRPGSPASGEALPSQSALGRLRQAAHRVGKQTTAFVREASKLEANRASLSQLVGGGDQIQVRKIGEYGWDGSVAGVGDFENEEALRTAFEKFGGQVLKAKIRHRVQDAKNVSHAIITMADAADVDRIMRSQPIFVGDVQLDITRVASSHGATFGASTDRDTSVNVHQGADQFTVPRTTVWIGHLPPQYASEAALKRVFSSCGQVVHVTVRYRSNGRSWALLTFRTNKEALNPLRSGFKDVCVIAAVFCVRPLLIGNDVLGCAGSRYHLPGCLQFGQNARPMPPHKHSNSYAARRFRKRAAF
eukprot:COSAG02_NODE_5295_length_4462_cov_106.834518_2_plen_802_part_00